VIPHVPDEDRARFTAALPQAGPSTITLRPVLIDKSLMINQVPDGVVMQIGQTADTTSMEIVPWKLIPHVIALEYLPLVLSVRRHPAPKVPPPTLIIDEEGIVHTNDCGPEQFEFQASQIRPIPIESLGYNAG
jgi:hypothetical protein